MEGYSVAHVMSVIGVMTACSLLVSLAWRFARSLLARGVGLFV